MRNILNINIYVYNENLNANVDEHFICIENNGHLVYNRIWETTMNLNLYGNHSENTQETYCIIIIFFLITNTFRLQIIISSFVYKILYKSIIKSTIYIVVTSNLCNIEHKIFSQSEF